MQLDDLINNVTSLKATIATKQTYIETLNIAAQTATTFNVYCIDSWSVISAADFIKLHEDSLTTMQANLQKLEDLLNNLQQSLDAALGLSTTTETPDTPPASDSSSASSSDTSGSSSATDASSGTADTATTDTSSATTSGDSTTTS